MNILVGFTGFVGSNLYREGSFDRVFHSTDIGQAFGLEPELLVYAGIRAEKYLADTEPEQDLENIKQAFQQIVQIRPQKLVLISTVDVYTDPIDVDENSEITFSTGGGYGRNRYCLEQMVRKAYPNALIIRLPALYGENLKKNFIYDYIHRIPVMLREEKYLELSKKSDRIRRVYATQNNGFYRYVGLDRQAVEVKRDLDRLGFSALNFTDSRSRFQFYPLQSLWEHLCIALERSLTLVNLATEPIRADELYRMWEGKEFVNVIGEKFPCYDCRSIHAELFGGKNGYIYDKNYILRDLNTFIKEEIYKLGEKHSEI